MHIWQDTHSLLHSCMKCTQWGTHGQEIHTTAHIEVKYTALCVLVHSDQDHKCSIGNL